jgi:hypothetical protein
MESPELGRWTDPAARFKPDENLEVTMYQNLVANGTDLALASGRLAATSDAGR